MANRTNLKLDSLKVKNFRALSDFQVEGLGQLNVLVGPNGAGKSTLLDVLKFLQDSSEQNVKAAATKRYGFSELTSDGAFPISIEFAFSKSARILQANLSLTLNELQAAVPELHLREKLNLITQSNSSSKKEIILDRSGSTLTSVGFNSGVANEFNPSEPSQLAFSVFADAGYDDSLLDLKQFIRSWCISSIDPSSLSIDQPYLISRKVDPDATNLGGYWSFISSGSGKVQKHIQNKLRRVIPGYGAVSNDVGQDNKVALYLRDTRGTKKVHFRFVSDGTKKLLAYMCLFQCTEYYGLITIEEPENWLHPNLLFEFAEECRAASTQSQIFVTTHSPQLLDGLRPEEVWVMDFDSANKPIIQQVSTMPRVVSQYEAGERLGNLWMEGWFEIGNPTSMRRGKGSAS